MWLTRKSNIHILSKVNTTLTIHLANLFTENEIKCANGRSRAGPYRVVVRNINSAQFPVTCCRLPSSKHSVNIDLVLHGHRHV